MAPPTVAVGATEEMVMVWEALPTLIDWVTWGAAL